MSNHLIKNHAYFKVLRGLNYFFFIGASTTECFVGQKFSNGVPKHILSKGQTPMKGRHTAPPPQ